MCDLMRCVYGHSDPVLARSVPQVLRSWKEGDRFVVRESFVEGTSLQRQAERRRLFWRREFLACLALVTEWVSVFQRASIVGHFVFEADAIRCLLKDLEVHVPAGTFRLEGRKTRVPAVVRHRDLRPANVLQTSEGLKIIDWDRFSMRGLPLLDLMEFVIRYVHARCMWQQKGMHLAPAVFRRYLDLIYRREGALSRGVHLAIGRYGEALGLDMQQQQLLLARWAHYMFFPGDTRAFCAFREK